MYEKAAALLLLLGIAGCEPTPEVGPGLSAAPSALVSVADPDSPAASPWRAPPVTPTAEASAAASGLVSASASSIAGEWWPAGVKEITVSWVLHPASWLATGGSSALLEVTAVAGKAHRTVRIQVHSTVMFMMYGQPDCDPNERRRRGREIVSQIYMNGGGNFMGSIERTATGVDVYTNESSDGLCDDSPARKPCPVDRKLVGSIPLPEGVTLRVRFVRVEALEDGKPGFREVPQACP